MVKEISVYGVTVDNKNLSALYPERFSNIVNDFFKNNFIKRIKHKKNMSIHQKDISIIGNIKLNDLKFDSNSSFSFIDSAVVLGGFA